MWRGGDNVSYHMKDPCEDQVSGYNDGLKFEECVVITSFYIKGIYN